MPKVDNKLKILSHRTHKLLYRRFGNYIESNDVAKILSIRSALATED